MYKKIKRLKKHIEASMLDKRVLLRLIKEQEKELTLKNLTIKSQQIEIKKLCRA